MADLARIARPWLPTLRRQMRTSTTTAAPSYLGLAYSSRRRNIGTTAACCAAQRSKYARTKSGRSVTAQEKEKFRQAEIKSSILLPQTIVPPPIWRFPLSPIKFAKMVWLLSRNRLTVLLSRLSVAFMSMPSRRLGWPKFRAHKRTSVPAAKALHVQMSEAVAAGDKETLRRICTSELFQTLANAVDARPPHVRAEWQLVRYEDRLRYPRLADFRLASMPLQSTKTTRLIKQAVVSISSVQRLARYDMTDGGGGGTLIPGSQRERRMMEHLVLQADIKEGTYEHGPWKVWGTLPEMSYETIRDETAAFQDLVAEQARRGKR
ncbi:hypothetical protein F5Y10DRAFT_238677 [Nemania abortiva]|nr:hypothetical protein F5Y10DRAFT_238677 [Nemania abortiva]